MSAAKDAVIKALNADRDRLRADLHKAVTELVRLRGELGDTQRERDAAEGERDLWKYRALNNGKDPLEPGHGYWGKGDY